jgi:hypothetical protein
MTHDELMALPENGGFDFEERIVNGAKVKIPIARPSYAMFHQESDPLIIMDLDGSNWTNWMIGRINGKLYRSRMSS